jgi:hypothetical protein
MSRLARCRLPGVSGWLQREGVKAAECDRDAMDCDDSPTRWLVFGQGAA